MCICIDCRYVDRCTTYHEVERMHAQQHLSDAPDFQPTDPTINVNIRTPEGGIEMEWDVVGCASFAEDRGRWIRLRPGQPVPT